MGKRHFWSGLNPTDLTFTSERHTSQRLRLVLKNHRSRQLSCANFADPAHLQGETKGSVPWSRHILHIASPSNVLKLVWLEGEVGDCRCVVESCVATIITSVFGQQGICSLLPAISFHFAKVRFNTASFSEIQEAPYIGNESRRSWKQNGYLVSKRRQNILRHFDQLWIKSLVKHGGCVWLCISSYYVHIYFLKYSMHPPIYRNE